MRDWRYRRGVNRGIRGRRDGVSGGGIVCVRVGKDSVYLGRLVGLFGL